MKEILIADTQLQSVMHLENPVRQSWTQTMAAIGSALGVPEGHYLPFSEWLQVVKALSDTERNPAIKLLSFLEGSFLRLATGEVVLGTSAAQSVSPTLKSCKGVSAQTAMRYVEYWRHTGFLA